MSMPEEAPLAEPDAETVDSISRRLNNLSRLVTFLAVACLLVAGCMTVSFYGVNRGMKQALSAFEGRSGDITDLDQMLRRIVADLQVLAKSNPNAEKLLLKHNLKSYGLDARSQASPMAP